MAGRNGGLSANAASFRRHTRGSHEVRRNDCRLPAEGGTFLLTAMSGFAPAVAPRRTREKGVLIVVSFLLMSGCLEMDPAPQNPVRELAPELADAGTTVHRALARAEAYRLQILVSEVVEPPAGRPRLRRWGFRTGAEYFYPASSIKLCAAVSALQEIERLEQEHGITGLVDAPLEIAPLFPGDALQSEDPGHLAHGRITVAHEIRKLALVSDNQAFNRLFDLVGHERLNRSMHALGLPSVVIQHRLSDPRDIPDPKASAAMVFHLPEGPAGHRPGIRSVTIPPRTSRWSPTNSGTGLRVGTAYLRTRRVPAGGTTIPGPRPDPADPEPTFERVPQPMDFTTRNGISLLDLQHLLVKLVRPDIPLPGARLDLSEDHRRLLIDALTRYPRESSDPRYSPAEYPDEYCKFLLPGVRRVLPDTEPGRRVEITGKIGRAYGFTIENSCLRNPTNGRTVFVTVAIHTNDDGVLNDDRYEYGTVADPFMADLGEWVARRWLHR